jgi:hypothetical protein
LFCGRGVAVIMSVIYRSIVDIANMIGVVVFMDMLGVVATKYANIIIMPPI